MFFFLYICLTIILRIFVKTTYLIMSSFYSAPNYFTLRITDQPSNPIFFHYIYFYVKTAHFVIIDLLQFYYKCLLLFLFNFYHISYQIIYLSISLTLHCRQLHFLPNKYCKYYNKYIIKLKLIFTNIVLIYILLVLLVYPLLII